MLKYSTGDILQDKSEALVNTVNCKGVMGRGLALEFKKAYPSNFDQYRAACAARKVIPGRMFITLTEQLIPPTYIVNFPTKRHWRNSSRLDDIEAGLIDLRDQIITRGIMSIAIPALGCSLGGLSWSDVRPMILETLNGIDAEITLYGPQGP